MSTWHDLDDGRGVLELNVADPALELELILCFSPFKVLSLHGSWFHSESGQVL